jgi:septum formation protein
MIVLASSSGARARLLSAAGVPHIVDPAGVDEEGITASLKEDGAPAADISEILAETKARQVEQRHPGRIIIGADQILECDGRLYGKPGSADRVRAQLEDLSGRSHRLWTSLCAVRGAQRIWHHTSAPELKMRSLTDEFMDNYVIQSGAAILACAGGYQLEAVGAQLFDDVSGDYFAVQGLPLLPLLRFLRANNIIKT